MSGTAAPGAYLANAIIDVAAQRVSFGPGLYVVTLTTAVSAHADGVSLPCVRLDPLPPSEAAPGTAHIACLNEGNWLTGDGKAAFLRVTGGQAALMLTTYNQVGAGQPPQVRIRLVPDDASAAGAIAPGTRSGPAVQQTADGSPNLSLVVHCSEEGSKMAGLGEWVEAAGPEGFIEAFCITAAADAPLPLEYQAIMGVDWVSPWAASPNLCGSVGLGLAIFGLRIRLEGSQADAFELVLWGRSGTREVGPVTSGELAFGIGQPLTALKLELRPARAAERRTRARRVTRPRTGSQDA